MESPRTTLQAAVLLAALAAAGLAWERRGEARAPQDAAPGSPTASAGKRFRPGPVPTDLFHPDLQPDEEGRRPGQPPPALGGSVTLQLVTRPARLASALDGSSAASRVQLAVHETLMRQDWELWTTEPGVARRQVVEDQLVLRADAAGRHPAARSLSRLLPRSRTEREEVALLYGELEDVGEAWRVVPRSPDNPLEAPLEVAKRDVREIVRDGVVTYELRDDVLWHPAPGFPAHRLDARDVLFSWSIYANSAIECDERRYQFEKVADAEQLGAHAVRFFLGRQDAWAVADLGVMCLFPAHLYDLADPDNPDHRPEASAAEQAAYVNENSRNTLWVGLGPWRVSSFEGDVIEAVRFEGYFDPSRAGYLERIRWRHFANDGTALQALLAGELDLFDRLSAEDYFGEATARAAFTERFYKAWTTLGSYAYICWNASRPPLDDARVRRALGHCLDVEGDILRGWYRGLGQLVTGPFPYHSPAYDHGVGPIPFDLDRARQLLAEAGWYDRDGDGWADRDGERLRLEYAAIAGNAFTRHVGLLLQENAARVGIELEVRDFEWGTFRERIGQRATDAFCQAWVPPIEPDPEQLWHSRWGQPGVVSANYPGLRDPHVDELIERGQRELDDESRWAVWRELHRRLAELAPYLWLVNPATKMAISRRLYGVQLFHVEPGYSVRRWYYPEGTPGTSPADDVGHWARRR